MKKKYILLIVIGIISTTSLLIVLVSKNNPKKFMQDGVMFAVKVDGVPQDHFPNDGNKYYVDIECENARGQWKRLPDSNGNNEDFKIFIDDIENNVTCSADFQTISIDDNDEPYKLSNVIKNTATHINSLSIPNFNSTVNINTNISPVQYDYSNATASSSHSGIGSLSVWSLNANNEYESDPSLMTYSGSRYYHIFAPVPEEGYYQICYTIASGSSSTSNRLYIAINSTTRTNISSSTSAAVTGCYNLGKLKTSDKFNISEYRYSSSTAPKITFTIEKATTEETSPGYRYIGVNPNNYIWFNNEMWRIIGLVPTCTSSGCVTSENLVKIVRKDSIGSIAYDSKSTPTGAWGGNRLYSLLNSYYWGKQNGTNTSGCYGYQTTTKVKCDYSVIGLSSSDYYGSMVENVYWNTGSVDTSKYINDVYISERSKQDIQGQIGLMNASDYGYIISQNGNVTIGSYGTDNWVVVNKVMFMNVSASNSTQNIRILNGYSSSSLYGSVPASIPAGNPGSVLPVVYLSPNVYVVGGDGTEATPYQIAKYSS